ncbi:MAG: DUF2059 domain-containing protein [Vicinamibacterales bacterium]
MRLLSTLMTAVVVPLLLAGPAAAQTIDEPLRADIRQLMDVMGATEQGVQMASALATQTLESLRRAQPGMPDRAVAIMEQVLREEFAKMFEGPDGLTEQLVAIYAAHFTRDDVRGLLAFYRSDLGRKTLTTMPAILQETRQAGQRTAERKVPRMMEILQQRLRDERLIP